MEKLNELAEQAKFIADWHGSDWSSALCQKKDGKQAHEIICESRGEAVISTGSNSNEASWLCDYLELCSPENILTIAEAFRELECEVHELRREKQNDNRYQELLKLGTAVVYECDEAVRRAEAAEAKLAQREKLDEEAMHCATILEFIGSFESDDIDGDLVDLRFEIDGEDTGSDVSITEYALRSAKAIRAIISGASISRPAPAADLAELVPDEMPRYLIDELEWRSEKKDGLHCYHMENAQRSWDRFRAAILRNIEDKGV